jgi:hypothetical protein
MPSVGCIYENTNNYFLEFIYFKNRWEYMNELLGQSMKVNDLNGSEMPLRQRQQQKSGSNASQHANNIH